MLKLIITFWWCQNLSENSSEEMSRCKYFNSLLLRETHNITSPIVKNVTTLRHQLVPRSSKEYRRKGNTLVEHGVILAAKS